jgi:hypothetical protein
MTLFNKRLLTSSERTKIFRFKAYSKDNPVMEIGAYQIYPNFAEYGEYFYNTGNMLTCASMLLHRLVLPIPERLAKLFSSEEIKILKFISKPDTAEFINYLINSIGFEKTLLYEDIIEDFNFKFHYLKNSEEEVIIKEVPPEINESLEALTDDIVKEPVDWIPEDVTYWTYRDNRAEFYNLRFRSACEALDELYLYEQTDSYIGTKLFDDSRLIWTEKYKLILDDIRLVWAKGSDGPMSFLCNEEVGVSSGADTDADLCQHVTSSTSFTNP